MSADKKVLMVCATAVLIVVIICITLMVLNNNPYQIGFSMDNNSLEAFKLALNSSKEGVV